MILYLLRKDMDVSLQEFYSLFKAVSSFRKEVFQILSKKFSNVSKENSLPRG